MNGVEKYMNVKVCADVGVSGCIPASNNENAASCAACSRANSTTAYDKDEISRNIESVVVNYLDRSLDQFATTVSDDIHNEVKSLPTVQQWPVRTP